MKRRLLESTAVAEGVSQEREFLTPSATRWRQTLGVYLAAVAERFCGTTME